MRQNEFWSRVFTVVPTATKNDGEEIDEKRFLQAIDFQIDNGVDGICIFGSTGGNGSFSDEEMKTATTIAAKHVNGRVPLVAGTGARTTRGRVWMLAHSEKLRTREAAMSREWHLKRDRKFRGKMRVANGE